MKKPYRLLAFFLAAVLLLSCTPAVMAYGSASGWAKPYVEAMEALGLIPASLEEAPALNVPMTREQMCDLLIQVYETHTQQEIIVDNERPFTDTESVSAAKAFALGIAAGMPDGTFGPERSLTREECCVFIYRLLDTLGTTLSGDAADLEYFLDAERVSKWSLTAVGAMIRYGVLQGSAGRLNLKDNVTSEQGLVLLYRVYTGLTDGTLRDRSRLEGMSKWAKPEITAMDEAGMLPNLVLYKNLSDNITRRELCYAAVQTFYTMHSVAYVPNPISPFKDVSDPVITAAYQLGLVQGYGNDTFGPDDLMTREQLFNVIGNFLMLCSYYRFDAPDVNVNRFSDWSKVSQWAQPSTRLLIDMGIVKGNSDSTLDPKGYTSRQSALIMFYRAYLAIEDWKQAAHTRPEADQLINLALQYVGYPYVWAGSNPSTGFDCSGFVYYLYRQIGYDIPRTADYQYLYGTPVSVNDLLPGDLMVFSDDGTWNGIYHIAIYLGNNQYIHAANSRRGVVIDDMPSYIMSDLYGCSRIIPG